MTRKPICKTTHNNTINMQHNKENNAQNKTIYSNGNANKTTHKTGQYNKQNAQNNST